MPSSYPGALDALTNPVATDAMNSVTVPHATVHSLANDAIEAVQAELGTNPSGAAATVVARLDALDTTVAGKAPATGIAPSAITGTAVVTGDSRLSDARTPTAHAASHTDGGSDEITVTIDQVTDLTGQLAGKAPTVSPALTGTPTAPTAAAGTNTTQIATTAFVQTHASPKPCLWLPGTSGNYISCPDSASLDITGDIDIRVKVAMDDWTPAINSVLLGKRTTGQYSYNLLVQSDGTFLILWTTDGSTQKGLLSGVAPGVSNGAVKWVRATLDVDNGSSQHVAKFYKSDDGTTWTQFGSDAIGSGVTSIWAGTAELRIGERGDGAYYAAGKYYAAQVYNGIDGSRVLNWTADIPGTRTRDSHGNLFTLNGTANAWMVA